MENWTEAVNLVSDLDRLKRTLPEQFRAVEQLFRDLATQNQEDALCTEDGKTQ